MLRMFSLDTAVIHAGLSGHVGVYIRLPRGTARHAFSLNRRRYCALESLVVSVLGLVSVLLPFSLKFLSAQAFQLS